MTSRAAPLDCLSGAAMAKYSYDQRAQNNSLRARQLQVVYRRSAKSRTESDAHHHHGGKGMSKRASSSNSRRGGE